MGIRFCCTSLHPDHPCSFRVLAAFREVFGQHLATTALKKLLTVFYRRSSEGSKPLVLSFHGTPGTGKNYIADHIVRARYKNGKQSNYVHGYSGRASFPLDSLAQQYSADLMKKIVALVKDCPHQTFIFDEVDKMPPGVFEAIVGLLDHNPFHPFRDVDSSKSLFIFISNVGGVEISDKLSVLMRREGYSREDTDLFHFEKVIEESAYNGEGAFQRSRAIEKAVIDYYVPFMPLEQRHVELCIKQLIAMRTSAQHPKIVQKVLKSVPFEKDTNMFAASGCKKLEARIDSELHTEL